MEGDQDHQSDDHSDQHLFNPRGSSSLTCAIFFKSSQDQGASHDIDDDHDQQKIKDQQLLPYQSNMNKNSDTVKHAREEEDRKKPTKWMSSKMRFMRKMMNPHNIIPNRQRRSKTVEFGVQQTNQDSTVIRVCSDCHTTKTPLWRTGPQGPKSLCNACGIRRRKARRVIVAAGMEGLDNRMIPADTWNEVEKQKRSNVDETMPFKKRCKIRTSQDTDKKQHCFDLSKSSVNLHSVLPQDERDAAILLMALSYGLICS